MKSKPSRFMRFLSFFTALYILNISVNTLDSTLYGYTFSDVYELEQNEVESLVELMLESTEIDENAVAEGTEQEPESKQPVKKIDLFTGIYTGSLYAVFRLPGNTGSTYLECQYTNYVVSLNSPPPEA